MVLGSVIQNYLQIFQVKTHNTYSVVETVNISAKAEVVIFDVNIIL